MLDLIGQSIGRYHIREQVGEGGMATVYKAYDTHLERDVAFKVLRTDQFSPAQLHLVLQRFEREAKSLAQLKHPNIVNILDFGKHEETPYLVMEFLPGGTLREKLGQPVPWQEAIRILLPVARGLSFAHQHGIIHRDVKPTNILIDANKEPVLTDFGVAKIVEGPKGRGLTSSGVGVGTPEYMAPEQGMGARTIDARADIYSLGIVFYEMVAGRKPYVADTPMAVFLKQMTDPLPSPTKFVPGLPEGVEQILIKALAKPPDDRYENMDAMIAAMEGVLTNTKKVEVQALVERAEAKTSPRIRSPRKVALVIIGTLAGILILVFSGLWALQPLIFAPTTTATSVSDTPSPPFTPSSTFTPLPPTATFTPSPSPTSTATPQPTVTNTPVPTWITNFAEPILAAIKDRKPDFQDDFSTGSSEWKVAGLCYKTGDQVIFKNGEITVQQASGCWIFREMWYPYFVLEVDARFLQGAPESSKWGLSYRNLAGGTDYQPKGNSEDIGISNRYEFKHNGDIIAYFAGPGDTRDTVEHVDITGAARAGPDTNHILIIAKGQSFAIYINNQPVYFKAGKNVWPNGGFLFDINDQVALDNLKIWNIANVTVP